MSKKTVTILGKGSSHNQCDYSEKYGSVWAVNDAFGLLDCKRLDRIFYFDHHFIGDWCDKGKGIMGPIRQGIHWVKHALYFRTGYLYQITPELIDKTGAILTTFKENPGVKKYEEYPLKEIIDKLGKTYFTDSIAYMVAFAIYKGYEKIILRGCDYSWGDEIHSGKRDCVEFWLGFAKGRGIEVDVGKGATLMARSLYGME